MTLTFLGQAYEANQSEVAAIRSEVSGMYRGTPMTFARTQAAPRSNQTLTYRGIHYSR